MVACCRRAGLLELSVFGGRLEYITPRPRPSDSAVTCIKLLPNTTYALLSQLTIDRTLAIVSEEGQATLDGGGVTRHLFLDSQAVVALSKLILRNGYASVRCAASPTPE